MLLIAGIRVVANKLDTSKILRRERRATERNEARAAATLRKIARRSLRRRKSVSKPGSPPSHRTNPGLKFILFTKNKSINGYSVGPVIYGRQRFDRPAPNIHEQGGSARITRLARRKKKRRFSRGGKRSSFRRAKRTRFARVYRFKERPFMRPALIEVLPKYLDLFKASI